MSSKFAKQFVVPPEFPDILKDFTREVLRNQPTNINEFAAKYFECLASGLPSDIGGGAEMGAAYGDEPDLNEVEGIIKDLFARYDQDGNMFLDPGEFKALMDDLQHRLEFPNDEVLRFLSEADMNSDGMIEYEEFIPLALQIIQGMYAKKRLEQHLADVDLCAEDLLVHGMSREELTDLVRNMFARIDVDHSGKLNKQEFVGALTSMELGLTRREINVLMFQVDLDGDGNINYQEFVPFAFEILQKLVSMRLLETELENDELGQYLMDLFRAKDVEMAGALHADSIRDVLHQAMLGLSRLQIYTVISEAEASAEGIISYAQFVPRAVGMIKSMLSFEKSIAVKSADIGPEAEARLYDSLEQVFSSGQLDILELLQFLSGSEVLINNRELQGIKNLFAGIETVSLDEAKVEIWALLKSMRRSQR